MYISIIAKVDIQIARQILDDTCFLFYVLIAAIITVIISINNHKAPNIIEIV